MMAVIYLNERTKALWEELKKIAKREGVPVSEIARRAWEDYIRKHGEGNPVMPLEKWNRGPEVWALPTLGEPIDLEKWMKAPEQELQILLKAVKARYEEALELARRRGITLWWAKPSAQGHD
jgi:hypothetical protein